MAEVIKWANNNGYNVILTVEEALELKTKLDRELRVAKEDDDIEFELEKK